MPSNERTPGRPGFVGASTPMVVVSDCCWLCGGALTAEIQCVGAPRPNLQWFCPGCEVSWSAPGTIA